MNANMNAGAARMSRLTLRFADAGLERAFAVEQAKKSLRPIRIALVCAGTLFVVSSPVVIQIAPYIREQLPRIVALVLATLGLCFALTHTQVFLRRHQLMMLALAACRT